MSSLQDLEEGLAELEGWLGREVEYDGVDEVTLNDIRRKLEVYCFDCPHHYGAQVAQAHGYRTVVAPISMSGLWAVPSYWVLGETSPWAPGLRERNGTVRSPAPEPYPRG